MAGPRFPRPDQSPIAGFFHAEKQHSCRFLASLTEKDAGRDQTADRVFVGPVEIIVLEPLIPLERRPAKIQEMFHICLNKD